MIATMPQYVREGGMLIVLGKILRAQSEYVKRLCRSAQNEICICQDPSRGAWGQIDSRTDSMFCSLLTKPRNLPQ